MGTDIYYDLEKKTDDGWETVYVPEFEINRCYLLFSLMADVRSRHDHVPTMAYHDGLPDNYQLAEEYEDLQKFWIMLSDVVQYFKNPPEVKETGVVYKGWYLQWDGKEVPFMCCQDIFGEGVKILDAVGIEPMDSVPADVTHVRIEWTVDVEEELGDYIDMFNNVYDKYGDLRIVFGFD